MLLLWGEGRGRPVGLVLALPRAGAVQRLRTRRARSPGDGIRLRTPLHHVPPARRARQGGGTFRPEIPSREPAKSERRRKGWFVLRNERTAQCCSTLDTLRPQAPPLCSPRPWWPHARRKPRNPRRTEFPADQRLAQSRGTHWSSWLPAWNQAGGPQGGAASGNAREFAIRRCDGGDAAFRGA